VDSFFELCLRVQATRRHVEALRTPLISALGIAASVYTHQLLNTLRVLTDIRVRHLLADEVGLGKTIQALMILNALRYSNPKLRALIIVPDRLVPQWRDEVFVRAHIPPSEAGKSTEDPSYIQLAWEAQFRNDRLALSNIDPNHFDILIVDELHSLTTALQDRIVRTAPEFNHILILTATPAFQHIKRHAELFAILEPERTAIARWKSVENLTGDSSWNEEENSSWSELTAQHVVQYLYDRDRSAASTDNPEMLEAIALAHCAYRRVIRTRRIDYPGVLPLRRHIRIEVEPIGAEADRQTLMWAYLRHLDTLTRKIDPVSLAKRVVLSPPSLEQRVDYLRRFDHDRDGLLERVKPLVHRGNGDSRADALIDLLQEIWLTDPGERVLVAAQDNLTVDYLFELVLARLPVIGPIGAKTQLVAARVRQGMMTEAVDDLGGHGNETNENLEAFQRGEANILFATEFAQVGLNLQCARVLILYSVPWRPSEVEQWIGRLDRIGNIAAYSDSGEAKTIDVYTIVQKGLLDARVVRVLESFAVFERGVNLDGTHLDELSRLIESAALNQGGVDWEVLEAQSGAMAAEDAIQELESPLRTFLRWTPENARQLKRRIESMKPLEPVIKRSHADRSTGMRAIDRAFEGFMELLERAGEYHIRRNTEKSGVRYKTLWYAFGNRRVGGAREVRSRVVFDCGANPHENSHPINALAFISRRGSISSPPLRRVDLQIDNQTANPKLHFLNFGDPIHDQLVSGWLSKKGASGTHLNVVLPDTHQFFERHSEGLYVGRIGIIDSAEALQPEESVATTMAVLMASATTSGSLRLAEIARIFERKVISAMEADSRWIRSELNSSMRTVGVCKVHGGWAPVAEDTFGLLLNPVAFGNRHSARSFVPDKSSDEVREFSIGIQKARQLPLGSANSEWGSLLEEFEKRLSIRRSVLLEERNDARQLGELELCELNNRLNLSQESGMRSAVTKAESDVQAALEQLTLTDLFWAQRDSWLSRTGEIIRSMEFHEHLVFALRVSRGRLN
jgi:ATP-dependent helicase HepA